MVISGGLIFKNLGEVHLHFYDLLLLSKGNVFINKKYLEGNGGTLGFTPTADYQFIRWMIWDAKANGGAGAEVTNGTTEATGKTDAYGKSYYYKYTDANGNIFYKNITKLMIT